MSRVVKTVKDNENNDVEVYADNCTVCSREMIFPKAEADKIEAMFPFIKEKVEAGTACVECALEKEKEDSNFMFSEEEKEKIKEIILNNA